MGNAPVDRVRNQQIPAKAIELDVLGAFTRLYHLLVISPSHCR